MKRMISQHAFGTEPLAATQFEYSRAIVAPSGADSLAQIGAPPRYENVTDRERLTDAWSRLFEVRATAPQRGPPKLIPDPLRLVILRISSLQRRMPKARTRNGRSTSPTRTSTPRRAWMLYACRG